MWTHCGNAHGAGAAPLEAGSEALAPPALAQVLAYVEDGVPRALLQHLRIALDDFARTAVVQRPAAPAP